MTALKSIQAVQGDGLYSPLAGAIVRVRGVATGRSGAGFYLQDPDPDPTDPSSCGIFVSATATQMSQFGPRLWQQLLEVSGIVLDYTRGENDRPSTQIVLQELELLDEQAPDIEPVWLSAETLPANAVALAKRLNNFESMVLGIRSGAVFSAPSNPFGDYVVVLRGMLHGYPQSRLGTAVLDPDNPERWFPGFRIARPEDAPLVNVGDRLAQDVYGPLSYRANSFQIVARGKLKVQQTGLSEALRTHASDPGAEFTSILTLNAFNLDTHRERPELVEDPRRDIDDDVGDQRFEMLAKVIVEQALSPAIVALQEIQDNDGAEITPITDAHLTYLRLIHAVRKEGGPDYRWADIAPVANADGGQPGGNIRNAYLYDPERIELVPDSLQLLGLDTEAFEGSRKPLVAHFRVRQSGKMVAVINVHLASKRHQYSIFAPSQAGFDPRERTRIDQALLIRAHLDALREQGVEYYVTGDFNDFDFSPTLAALCGETSVNLVDSIPVQERFDYNHRGKLHTLMHAIVSKSQAEAGRWHFQILHGNELQGVQPGALGTRATDHAYVVGYLLVQ